MSCSVTPTEIERLRGIVAREFGVPIDRVVDDAHLNDDLGADDLDRVGMVMSVETAFEVSIEDGEIDAMTTFGELRWVLTAKLQAKAA